MHSMHTRSMHMQTCVGGVWCLYLTTDGHLAIASRYLSDQMSIIKLSPRFLFQSGISHVTPLSAHSFSFV